MKRILFVLMGHLLLLTWQLQAQIPTAGLVAFYPFNSNTLDSSGLGNHAVPGGCSYVADRFGNPASALYLDGVSDSLVIDLPGYTPMTGDFSFSFWIKTNSPEVGSLLSLTQYPGDTIDNYNFYLNYHGPLQSIAEIHYGTVSYWGGSGWASNRMAESNSMTYTDGEWKHMLVRRRNDTLQFWNRRYPLGEYIFSGPIGDALPFVVGALPFRYKGTIDDLAFYNRALSDQEINRLQHDHQPYIFTTTHSTDAYVVGDTAEIWWVADTSQVSDSIDLDYSTDGGATWLPTGHNQMIDWTPLRWPLPFAAGANIDVRIRDHLNPAVETHTGTFTMSEYAWENVSPSLPFTPRDGVGLLNFDGKMWLIGGWDPPYHMPDNTHSEIWNSTDGANWNYLGDAPWHGRHCSGWVVHDSAMWVVGGDPQSGALSDVWRSTDGVNWTLIADTIPNLGRLRTMHITASTGGNIFYMGGQPYGGIDYWNFNEVWASPDGANWTRYPDAPWPGRGMVLNSAVDDAGAMWVMGGGRLMDRRFYNDVWKSDDGINWTLINDNAPWNPRGWHNIAYFDHKLWVLCGLAEQTDANDVWYSSDGVEWHQLMNSRFPARHAGSATVYDNSLWLMCGIASNNSWRLRNTLAPTSSPDSQAPVGRVVWYPNPTGGLVRASQTFQSAVVSNSLGQRVRVVGAGQEIDLAGLPAGVYVVRAVLEAGTSTHKVIKY